MRVDRAVVVVGIDGSPEAMAAATWAAEEASRRHAPLHLLCAYNPPVAAYPGGAIGDFSGELKTSSEQAVATAGTALAQAHPELTITTSVLRDDPRRALVEASENAELTVIGTRGRGQVQEVTLGSVALHVSAHGRSPVAVVPGPAPVTDGPIVLGVDGRSHTDAAVQYAFDEAAVRGVDLVVLLALPQRHALSMTESLQRSQREVEKLTHEFPKDEYPWWESRPGYAGALPPGESPEAHLILAEQIAGWREKYPDVRVRPHVVIGRPADALLGWADRPENELVPQMIVVGSRGRGGLTGLMLGSTGQRLITHAAVPVVVVHPLAAAEDVRSVSN